MATLFVDPGALRTELILEFMAATPDDAGGFTEGWSEIATVFARIEPVAASSVFGADQAIETVTHRVTLRFRGDLASGMRLRKQERVLAILTVHDPDESSRYLVCRCREIGR